MKIGCDPEIFLVDAAGAYVSAIDKIGGSKAHPRPLPVLGKGYAVQEDNVAIEFNIPPAEDMSELKNNVNKVKLYLQEQITKMGYTFSKESAAVFPLHELMHPAAQVFGCDPDFDAWKNGAINPKPKANDWRLRSCGGHVHIGEKIESESSAISLIKWMDLMAGVPSVVLDKGDQRKQLYGKRGAYRLKPYGVEYRVLSNFWIWDDHYIEWVWKATQAAVKNWRTGDDSVLDAEDNFIAQAINENNRDVAHYLIDKHNLAQYYA